jgi:hypothetical protein
MANPPHAMSWIPSEPRRLSHGLERGGSPFFVPDSSPPQLRALFTLCGE